MSRTICPNCGSENQEGTYYCSQCGYQFKTTEQQTSDETTAPTSISTGHKVCPGCGAKNAPSSKYCYHCGLLLPMELHAAAEMEAIGTPAGFWIRLVAYLIDGIVVSLIALLLAITFTDASASQVWAIFSGEVEDWTISIIPTMVDLAYFTICIGRWGQTVGKKVLSIKVLRSDNSPMSYPMSFARSLAYYLSALIFGIGFLMIAFSSNKRGLHDRICDTKVVKIRT